MALKTVLYLLTVFVYAHSRVEERDPKSDAASYELHGLSPNVSDILPAKYIAGGEDAEMGKFPWMAYLNIQEKDHIGIWVCGGSLISTRHVLTAAHCLCRKIKHYHDIKIYLGEYNTNSYPKDCAQDKCVFNKLVYPDKVIMHANYNSAKNNNNDIALLRLEKRIRLTPSIQPIPLPPFDIDDPANAMRLTTRGEVPLVIAGWGDQTKNNPKKNILQAAIIKLVPKTQCLRIDPSLSGSGFCAGNENGSTCGGDSGGPVLMYYRNKYYLVGITSSGYFCGSSAPNFFTNVFRHMKWVTSHTEMDSNIAF